MRLPTDLIDKSILNEEPLSQLLKKNGQQDRDEVIKKLGDSEGGMQAVRAWYKYAFPATAHDRSPDFTVFVNFFSHLICDKERALVYLEAKRAEPIHPSSSSLSQSKCGRKVDNTQRYSKPNQKNKGNKSVGPYTKNTAACSSFGYTRENKAVSGLRFKRDNTNNPQSSIIRKEATPKIVDHSTLEQCAFSEKTWNDTADIRYQWGVPLLPGPRTELLHFRNEKPVKPNNSSQLLSQSGRIGNNPKSKSNFAGKSLNTRNNSSGDVLTEKDFSGPHFNENTKDNVQSTTGSVYEESRISNPYDTHSNVFRKRSSSVIDDGPIKRRAIFNRSQSNPETPVEVQDQYNLPINSFKAIERGPEVPEIDVRAASNPTFVPWAENALPLEIFGNADYGNNFHQYTNKKDSTLHNDSILLEPEAHPHDLRIKKEPRDINLRSLVISESEPKHPCDMNFIPSFIPHASASSKNIPAGNSQPPKIPLWRLPPIWAESRQEVCESFDWFRSYQGGVYHAHNTARGYLLSAFPSRRDKFEHRGKLIISHGGGKAESIHSSKGKLASQPASDQLIRDKSVRALYDNYLHERPLVLIMDDKYALFPFDLTNNDINYAVLGFYTIVAMWAEYQPAQNEAGRVVRYKFAFRWCDHQGQPWWIQDAEKDIVREDSDVLQEKKKLASACSFCKKIWQRVFDLCWACLNPECHLFWKQDNGQYLPDDVDYHPTFLKILPSKTGPPGFEGLLLPPLMTLYTADNVTSYAFTRGFHCNHCGRLSCRSKWEKWECVNCGAFLNALVPPRQADEFIYQTLPINFKDYSLNINSGIVQLPSASFNIGGDDARGLLHTFVLPFNRGKIHHIQAVNSSGRKDADTIFLDYQLQATSGELKFRRWPMRAHKCRGALLTNYFSQNVGEPYKYVGGDANTVSFDAAPGAVVKAREFIQKRIIYGLGICPQFNEVLSAAYMERQKMAFHSDNEVGLGPLVAGLSLGSPALMHFRVMKHGHENEQKGIMLSIVLRHGDILVMDGAGVQENYEHTVVPSNFRIAATARQIN